MRRTSSEMYEDCYFNEGENCNEIGMFIFCTGSASPPISGCTDTSASNYDESAIYDDGSCEYIQPQIDYISPNSGQQGDSLSVAISGSNMWFSDYSGGWFEYSSFQLVYSDYSDTYTINGSINEDVLWPIVILMLQFIFQTMPQQVSMMLKFMTTTQIATPICMTDLRLKMLVI